MIIGTIGSCKRAQVRGGGTIVLHEGTLDEIELAWWVGADDRWHVAERAVTARQHLVRDVPVVQTSLRVPGGDAIATAFATVQGPRELVVIDVENRSKLPFALALVLRGPGVRDVTLDGNVVRVAGVPLLYLPRRPQRMAAVPAIKGAPTIDDIVMSGGAGDSLVRVDGASSAAFLLPAAHATTTRCAILVSAGNSAASLGAPVLSALPTIHTVANGWSAQLQRSVSVKLPDAALGARLTSHAAALLLASEPVLHDTSSSPLLLATLASALDRVGFADEAVALLQEIPDRQGARGAFAGGDPVCATAVVVSALGQHALLSHNSIFAAAMSPTVAGAIEFLARQLRRDRSQQRWSAAVRSAADVFQIAGDGGAVKQAMRLWEKQGCRWPLPDPPLAELPAAGRGGSFVPDDPTRLALAAGDLVESVVAMDVDGTVDLLRGFDESWRGQAIEVRNVPTSAGQLSYAIRWHGARPALLWEIEPRPGIVGGEPLRLRASALDPAWSGDGMRGDALLATPAPVVDRVVAPG